MNKTISFIIISIALLYLAYNVNIDELIISFSNYSYYSIIYVICITILSFIFFTLRWQQLSNSNLSFYNSYKTNLISMAINQIIPARAGDLYKPIYIKKKFWYSY